MTIYTRPDKLKCSNENYLARVQDVFDDLSVGGCHQGTLLGLSCHWLTRAGFGFDGAVSSVGCCVMGCVVIYWYRYHIHS